MATLQEFKDALALLVEKVVVLNSSVDADIEQVSALTASVNVLIEAIKNSGTTDFAAEVAAVQSAMAGVEQATAKITSDNDSVQAAIDAAAASGTVVPPPPPPPEQPVI